ncbi:hypothetical protein [Microseira wollei]|uniref:Uncharacterized protein n=1 Tax=Microseira wollei NIES-4236 TaxID=2530354 RepID=A0AAV3XCN2_9CYAN|nr:hypothetical protein [Microseira wollei]GET38411.1 hypothetical protein MiSe_31690 [Microseira wollei NIES-4236]
MTNKTEELLQEFHPLPVSRILVMSEVIGILTSVLAKQVNELLKIDRETSEKEMEFIMSSAAQKADSAVMKYSVEQIIEELERWPKAKEIAKDMKGQTKEELLEQSYPTTVTEILVMLNVISNRSGGAPAAHHPKRSCQLNIFQSVASANKNFITNKLAQ